MAKKPISGPDAHSRWEDEKEERAEKLTEEIRRQEKNKTAKPNAGQTPRQLSLFTDMFFPEESSPPGNSRGK